MDCLRGPKGTESTVHYFPISDTYEAINLFKLQLFLDLLFLSCCLTSLLFISIFLVCTFSVFMIILVEINVKGFLCECVKGLLSMVKITKWPIVKDIGHF